MTASVLCDDEAMTGHQVDFESLGDLGSLSPASVALSASGTGTGHHNTRMTTAGECQQQGLSAPAFSVTVSGTVVGDNLEFIVVAMTIPLNFSLLCRFGDNEAIFPYPIYGLLESSMMAQFIIVNVPWEDGGTDSGSGIDPTGDDIPTAYSYTITLSGS